MVAFRFGILTILVTAASLVAVPSLRAAAPGKKAPFGHKGGPDIENIDELRRVLRKDAHSMELIVSFGNSAGGSAGHLAVAIRGAEGAPPGDDLVFTANRFCDLKHENQPKRNTDELILTMPKMEYLFRTTSKYGDKGLFGLDMGEIFKRAAIGIRIYGVPEDQRKGIADFHHRLNRDWQRQKARPGERLKVDYFPKPIIYEYMGLNCAVTTALAFNYGAGYKLKLRSKRKLNVAIPIKALKADLPTEVALKIIDEAHARGHAVDVILYKKYWHSTYKEPLEPDEAPFKDIPNRFPSVLSLDFKEADHHFEDYHNIRAMYLLFGLGRYWVALNEKTRLLEITGEKDPTPYAEAVAVAEDNARELSKSLPRRAFRALLDWHFFGDRPDHLDLYNWDKHRSALPKAPIHVRKTEEKAKPRR